MATSSIENRVVRAAEAALRYHDYVSPLDVLMGLGWLQPVHRDHWRQGRAALGARQAPTPRIDL